MGAASRCSPPVSIRALRPCGRSAVRKPARASYDSRLQDTRFLGKTLFAPGAWMMLYRGGKRRISRVRVSPENAVARGIFPCC